MDYKQIDKILNKYLDALTNTDEEKQLKKYFSGNDISPEHLIYKPLFDFYEQERFVTNPEPIRYQIGKPKKNYFLAIAATLIIGLGIFGLIRKTNKHIQVAGKDTKNKVVKEMKVYTKHLNEGIKNVSALSLFGQKTQKVFKVHQDTLKKKTKENK